jgi:sugar lactone lactonase YvrE
MTKVGSQKITREPGYLYYVGSDGYIWATPMKHNKSGKKRKIGTEHVTREKGYLYYVDGEGYVGRAKQKRK